MKYVFPAVFSPEDGLYNVSFPDLPDCYTCGNDLADAVYMASDVLAGYLSRAEERSRPVPAASDVNSVNRSPQDTVTLVFADTDAYRRAHSDKAVKKTLTIPAWLNSAAEAQGVNFSQALQEALRHQLGFEA